MAKTMPIYREKVQNFLENLNGRMFSVDYFKQDGTIRTLNGRLAVKRHCKGTGRNPAERDDLPYITVWETPKPQDPNRDGRKRYRNLNLASVQAIRANGVEFDVI